MSLHLIKSLINYVITYYTLRKTIERRSNVYLNQQVLTYVKELKYLGHIITEASNHDADIERERRNMTDRWNIHTRKFSHCSDAVKRTVRHK